MAFVGDELAQLEQLYTSERGAGIDYPDSLALPMVAVLSSPKFLFRIELDPEQTESPVRELNPYELATRLSYFLWSSMPDDELFRLAGEGTLNAPNVLEAEVERMLSDPKAEALLQNFVGQWLQGASRSW